MSEAPVPYAVTAGIASGIALIVLFAIFGPGMPQPPFVPQPIINLNNNSSAVILPVITAHSPSSVHAVWDDDSDGNDQFEIFSTTSLDGGKRFSNLVRVSLAGNGIGTEPDISSAGSNVYVVWQEQNLIDNSIAIYFARSTNAGVTYDMPIRLTDESKPRASTPHIASQGSSVFVVWTEIDQDHGYSPAFLTKSTNEGKSFGTPRNLNPSESVTNFVWVATEGSNVFVIWDEYVTPGNSEIFLARSGDGGDNFAKPVNISNSATESKGEQMIVDGENVYVVWYESNDGIFLAHSGDSGESFDLKRLAPEGSSALDPRMAASGSRIYVTWSQLDLSNNLVLGTYDITGYSNTTVLGNSSPGRHDVTADSSGAYVVWDDLLDKGKLKIVKLNEQGVRSQPVIVTEKVTEPENLTLLTSDDSIYLLWDDVNNVLFKKIWKKEFQ